MGNSPVLDYEKLKAKSIIKQSKLSDAISYYACNMYEQGAFQRVWEELTACYGKAPHLIKTSHEFFSGKLIKALNELGGEGFVEDVRLLVQMRLTGQFSSSMYRRSYRTPDFGYYAVRIIEEICCYLRICSYKQTVEELIGFEHEYIRYYESALALEICKGNQRVIDTIRDMILGDNNTAVLTRKVIQAIIISGNRELIDLVKQLLIAARLQEGLRQSILESTDEGRLDTFIEIYKVCLDEDMFRYSSAARALFTWTGLNIEEIKIPVVRNIARVGYECLTDRNKREEYFNSPNALEAYLSIWAQGCEDVEGTDRTAEKLLTNPKKYRRLLGWYFISHVENPTYRQEMAAAHLDERDEETLAYITANLYYNPKALATYTYRRTDWSVKPLPDDSLPKEHGKRCSLFGELKKLALYIGNQNREFNESLFSFLTVRLSNERVINCMMSLAAYDMDEDMIGELYSMMDVFTADQRRAFFLNLLDPSENKTHRCYLYDGLKDRSVDIKELSIEKLDSCSATADDIRQICGVLTGRSAKVRKQAMAYLSKQTESLRQTAVTELKNGTENQMQAAIELLTEDKELAAKNSELINSMKSMDLSTQTEIMLNQLEKTACSEDHFSPENGYGLYDMELIRKTIASYASDSYLELKKASKSLFARQLKRAYEHIDKGVLLSKEEILSLIPQKGEIVQLLDRMNAVFEAHKDYEYEVEMFGGSLSKVLLGDASYAGLLVPAEYGPTNRLNQRGELRFNMVPFHEEFAEVLKEYMDDGVKLLMLYYCCNRASDYLMGLPSGYEAADWFVSLENTFSSTVRKDGYDRYKYRYWQMADIIKLAFEEADNEKIFNAAYDIYFSMHEIIGEEKLMKVYAVENGRKSSVYVYGGMPVDRYVPANHNIVSFYRRILNDIPKTEEQFTRWFKKEYAFELSTDFRVSSLSLQQYVHAAELKLIPKDSISQWILHPNINIPMNLKSLSDPVRNNKGMQLFETYPWMKEFSSMLIRRMVEVEANRGEIPTDISTKCHDIMKFEGAEYFCRLLSALGKDNFFRGYDYSRGTTKQEVLSQLLKRCYPSPDDTACRLQGLLKRTDITDKRLVEAAMYAPQWAGLAEEVTGWTGLRKAVWFFHAHISEHFSAEKETEVAIYSPISPIRFNDGAFDLNWFRDVYSMLGENRFKVLYKCAKYITNGSIAHRRAQLYSDAVMGGLDAIETENEITEKRNQEKLRAYALIPLSSDPEHELLRRYEFIKRFEKESRQFGAQRRESERKACQAALENLAITAGKTDVNRLIWQMESAKLEEIRPLMEKQEVNRAFVWLGIDEDGNAGLLCEKNGKLLKSLPSSLNKNQTILELKQRVKELREQRQRSRATLEQSMVNMCTFTCQELYKILGNPVIAPMVERLIWITEYKQTGFARADKKAVTLTDASGAEEGLMKDAVLRIAHPHDLIKSGNWADYMQAVYKEQIVQPFKQVFREYYTLTSEEKQEKTISRRYSGYQVQPQKTTALLKGKGWTVDYEEGLQKVCYGENLIVRLYALADWFSPADIEAPTLETIQFFRRADNKQVDLEAVNPILFSEIMRDIDLVVSVAYVGGVDAETSHSTIQLRTAIAAELVKLMKLTNVTFTENHAKIIGKLGSYSVHMGSGIVHAEAKGMVAIIPVHSQHRGRIFLPFADEDPKTAEIMSKIVLLAEDGKIKDPEILSQLR